MAVIRGIPTSVNPNSRIKGFDIVMARLNKELKAIENRSSEGLIDATGYIRKKTEKEYPRTPFDLGNLKASWFVATGTKIAAGVAPKFKGPDAQKMTSDHSSALSEAKGIVKANEANKGKFVMAGYSVNYALFIHEKQDAKFKRYNSGPKWLETHVKNSAKKIVQIVGDKAKVK